MEKNIIIFGGSGLIGYQIYKFFLKKNYNVLIGDIKKKKKSDNFYKINVNSSREIKKFMNKFNNTNVVINCIYPRISKIKKIPFNEHKSTFLKKINQHLGSYFLINKEFINFFLKNNINGNIINFSSIYGSFVPRFEIYKNTKMTMPLDYMIAKNSINIMTKYFAKFILGSRIKINSISPGGIYDKQDKSFLRRYTSYTNHRSLLDSEDILMLVDLLVSSKNLKITGQNFLIDDGFTI
jgi:NAD(P)-dependent dehydrogenase (short-subunit alcohol dehydrogenase family)